jgi:hypothetical protein
MFEHFTSVACEFLQPLLFTPQKSTSMEVMLIFSHKHSDEYFSINVNFGVFSKLRLKVTNFHSFRFVAKVLKCRHQKKSEEDDSMASKWALDDL